MWQQTLDRQGCFGRSKGTSSNPLERSCSFLKPTPIASALNHKQRNPGPRCGSFQCTNNMFPRKCLCKEKLKGIVRHRYQDRKGEVKKIRHLRRVAKELFQLFSSVSPRDDSREKRSIFYNHGSEFLCPTAGQQPFLPNWATSSLLFVGSLLSSDVLSFSHRKKSHFRMPNA